MLFFNLKKLGQQYTLKKFIVINGMFKLELCSHKKICFSRWNWEVSLAKHDVIPYMSYVLYTKKIVQRMNNSSNAKADILYVGFSYVIVHCVSSWIFMKEVTGEKILL